MYSKLNDWKRMKVHSYKSCRRGRCLAWAYSISAPRSRSPQRSSSHRPERLQERARGRCALGRCRQAPRPAPPTSLQGSSSAGSTSSTSEVHNQICVCESQKSILFPLLKVKLYLIFRGGDQDWFCGVEAKCPNAIKVAPQGVLGIPGFANL